MLNFMISNIKAVISSFLGIRKRSDLEKDIENLKLWQVLLTAVVLAIIFVLIIILLVNQIV